MTEKIAAIPCPFCGNEEVSTNQSGPYVYIECDSCGAAGPGVELNSVPGHLYEAELESCEHSAIEIWNNRTISEDDEDMYHIKRDEYVIKLEAKIIEQNRKISTWEGSFEESRKRVWELEKALLKTEADLTLAADKADKAEKNAFRKFHEQEGW